MSTEQRIRELFSQTPGLKARQIASKLGLDKREAAVTEDAEHPAIFGGGFRGDALHAPAMADFEAVVGEDRASVMSWSRDHR